MRHKESAILSIGSRYPCGHSSRVEPERATLEIRVRFPVTAPARGSPAVHRRRCRRGIRSASFAVLLGRKARFISAAAAVRLCPQRPVFLPPELEKSSAKFSTHGAHRLVTIPVSHTGPGEFDPLAPYHGFDSREATRANAGASCGSSRKSFSARCPPSSPTRVYERLAGARRSRSSRDLEDGGSNPSSPIHLRGCSSVGRAPDCKSDIRKARRRRSLPSPHGEEPEVSRDRSALFATSWTSSKTL
ncbi:MAG: hypothetical protein JWP87_5700 [Labilithrix sp.]|nr:hypothetical protein [Labilithrix sp.]